MCPGPRTHRFGGLDVPGGPRTLPNGGALRAPLVEMVSGAPGAVQIPKIYDFWVPDTFGVYKTGYKGRKWGHEGPKLGYK